MNDNKQQRLDKLTAEYNDLNGKISRLDAFLNRLDFETTVPDSEEQMLMQHQLNAMRSYRTNLKERIQLLQAQIKAGSPCDDRVVTSATHHCGQDTRHRDEAAKKLCDLLVKGRMIVYVPDKKCDKCGGNMFEGFGEEEGGKILCFNCASQITTEELQQALDEYRSACLHHCCQDAHDPCGELGTEGNPIPLPSPVGGGSAAVNQENGDSLKDLLGMEVISVGDMPCDACKPDNYAGRPCVKVELVGGTYLCLAPRPNSIITE